MGRLLGGMIRVGANFHMPTAAIAAQALGLNADQVTAVWSANVDTPTPFDPIWVGTEANGQTRTVTMRGQLGILPQAVP